MGEFLASLQNRLYLNLIHQNRWHFLLEGLLTTLLLTFSAFIAGSLLGALLCICKRSRYKWLGRAVDILTQFFVRLPTLVLLMLMIYVIFVNTALSLKLLVILGLTVKSAAYIYSIFYTAVETVSPGEKEAARSLGLSKREAFLRVVLPQAVRQALPIYKNQFVITLQETAVVGYLAVQDLTRASDIITSRTFDAVAGLVIVSLLYILIGCLASALLSLLGREKHLSEADL